MNEAADRARDEPPDAEHVLVEDGPLEAHGLQLLVQRRVGHRGQEHVQGKRGDDDVIEHAEQREPIRDEVDRQGQIACGRGEQRLPGRGHPAIDQEPGR